MRIHWSVRIARLGGGAAALAVLLLSGCGGAVNVVSEGADSDLMLRGNDPVAYFTAGRAVAGSSEIKTEHRGLTYRFASVESRRQFITSPERYVPQFGGFCAQSMAYAVPVPADGNSFKIIDGRLYLFDGARAALFRDGPGAQPGARPALLGNRGPGFDLAAAGLEAPPVARARQIGRASCRERVSYSV